ncbi:MAG: GNAT family N-acetyltransferase [Anaerolineaceae bacterium]|nr:GNAT family N-acetyltransferase [Anaerolineaceae bacterium]
MAIFRPAHADDAPELTQAAIASFHYDSVLYPEVEIGGPPGYDSVDVMLRNIEEQACFAIVEDDQIVGGMVINVMGAGHYHLDLIFLAPEYQNRGLGTQALQFLESTFLATKWTLDTPIWAVRNRHFYEKHGYVNVGQFYVEADNITLISYEKTLST